jgi:hypothetical protein
MATRRSTTPVVRRKSASSAPDISPLRAVDPNTKAPVAIFAGAKLLWVEPGLHKLVVAPTNAALSRVRGMGLPAVVVTAINSGEGSVELMGRSGSGNWIGNGGGTVVLRAPPGGGDILVTAYAPAGQLIPPLDIELSPIDAISDEPAETAPPQSLRVEVILHIEREGDRRFLGEGWAGHVGSRRRIEAIAIRPQETISSSDIEYKAYAVGGRETPWVSGGRFSGTRGQSLPLTGFAIRLAPRLQPDFDVFYRGAFFSSGAGAPVRNGEPCAAPVRDDPIEAVEVKIIRRNGS